MARQKGSKPLNTIHIPKVVRNIALSAIVLLILAIAAGIAYTLISDQRSSAPKVSSKTTSLDTVTPIKPVLPAANDSEGVAIESLSTPVSIGSPATIAALTNAGSICTISLLINNIPKALGLAPVTADQFGGISWSWTVSSSTPVGVWPVKISCQFHTQTGVVEGDMTVTR